MGRAKRATFLFFCFTFSLANAAEPPPYQPGEKTSYSITYFGATAGILDLEVLSPTELSVKARTDSIFSFFYRFQNSYVSTINASSSLPEKFVTTHDETKLGGTVTQLFDQAKKKVTYVDRRIDRNSGNKLIKDFVKDIPASTQDVVSIFFYVRTLPLAKGKKFEVPVFIGEENCLLSLEVVDEESIVTKIGDVPSFVIKPSLIKDGKNTEIPETFLWIAKDKNRAMVKLKAKVKIGSVVGYLRSYTPGKMPEPVKNTAK